MNSITENQYKDNNRKQNDTVSDILGSNVGGDKTGIVINRGAEGERINFSDNQRSPVKQSTLGTGLMPFRKRLGAINLTSDDSPGVILAALKLDLDFFSEFKSQRKYFVNWRINDLQLEFVNTAPFAEASGSIQIFYINDPSNEIATGDNVGSLMMRLAGSKQIRAKEDGSLDLNYETLGVIGQPNDDWKLCNYQGQNIFSRYGTIGVAARVTPVIGEGALFAVTLSGTVEFTGMTMNLMTTYKEHYSEDTFSSNTVQCFLSDPNEIYPENFHIFAAYEQKINGIGEIAFANKIDMKMTAIDVNDSEAVVYFSMLQANVRNTAGNSVEIMFNLTSAEILALDTIKSIQVEGNLIGQPSIIRQKQDKSDRLHDRRVHAIINRDDANFDAKTMHAVNKRINATHSKIDSMQRELQKLKIKD